MTIPHRCGIVLLGGVECPLSARNATAKLSEKRTKKLLNRILGRITFFQEPISVSLSVAARTASLREKQ